MNPENYGLSREVLDDIRIKKWKKENYGNRASLFDEAHTNGPSPAEQVHHALEDVYRLLSDPLKKMKSEYLSTISNKCYQEKHLTKDFTNDE